MTTTITTFNKATLQNLRNDLDKVLAQYGVEAGIEINTGNISFSEGECTIKVEAKIPGGKSKTHYILEMEAKRLGLNLTNSRGDELTGYNTRAKKMPFEYKAKDGGMYKCCERTAKQLFAA